MTRDDFGKLMSRDVMTEELVERIYKHPVRELPTALVASVVALIDVHFPDHQEPKPTGGSVLRLVVPHPFRPNG